MRGKRDSKRIYISTNPHARDSFIEELEAMRKLYKTELHYLRNLLLWEAPSMIYNKRKILSLIVKKLEKILDTNDMIDSFNITISGSQTEAPTIEYKIKEFVRLDEVEEDRPTTEGAG